MVFENKGIKQVYRSLPVDNRPKDGAYVGDYGGNVIRFTDSSGADWVIEVEHYVKGVGYLALVQVVRNEVTKVVTL